MRCYQSLKDSRFKALNFKECFLALILSFSSVAFANNATLYSIASTSGISLTGTFLFAGELGNNGTFNFGTDGNPLSSPSFAVPSFSVSRLLGMNYQVTSTGSLIGSFLIEGELANGLQNFGITGTPLSSPSFSWTGGSATNLPNQNDRYLVSGGSITALKYDLNKLSLLTNNTYNISDRIFSPPTETGTYTVAATPVYVTNIYSAASFSNSPNQNDRYTVSGGNLTTMKYDLYGPDGELSLGIDGSFALRNSSHTVIATGTYALSQVPEPSIYSLVFMAIGTCCLWLIRRRAED